MELFRDEFALPSKKFLKCIFAIEQKICQILDAVPLPKDSDQLAYSRAAKYGQSSVHIKNITAITDRIRDWLPTARALYCDELESAKQKN